jgi:hypothetical protein
LKIWANDTGSESQRIIARVIDLIRHPSTNFEEITDESDIILSIHSIDCIDVINQIDLIMISSERRLMKTKKKLKQIPKC